MRPSTVLEVAGFAVLAFAAYRWNHLVGFVTAGVVLLLMGYSFDDAQAIVSIQRVYAPVRMARARRKLAREGRKARRLTQRDDPTKA